MMRFTIILGLILLMLSEGKSYAQQGALYSQYMFNPFSINPAYAGSRTAFSGVLLGRQQWSGIDGAPFTGSFALHSPIGDSKMAAGFNYTHDELGPTSTDAVYATGAYHLKLSTGKLSFGLRGGIISSNYNYNLLNYDQPDDFDNLGELNETAPSFDFGMYYYTNKFYLGLAANHIGSTTPYSGGINNGGLLSNNIYSQHLLLSSGLAIELNNDMVFKPSIFVKYVQNTPVNFDVNASMLFKKVFWLGFSYRHGSALAIITEYNVTDWIRLGYSYDVVLNRLKRFSSGSHELFIGFDFLLKKDRDISPRYM